MTRRDAKVRLLHMLDYTRKAVVMVYGQQREDPEDDEKLRFALTHVVELRRSARAASRSPLA